MAADDELAARAASLQAQLDGALRTNAVLTDVIDTLRAQLAALEAENRGLQVVVAFARHLPNPLPAVPGPEPVPPEQMENATAETRRFAAVIPAPRDPLDAGKPTQRGPGGVRRWQR